MKVFFIVIFLVYFWVLNHQNSTEALARLSNAMR
uniref:Uncharacterized protein n=1 Tax=uncultured marine bacterium 581 TaxID=257401 RepID=Q6SFC1_9BACT|nr:hypothetical protein MBMO_EBAC000-69B03.50 [uncultured marine bacterium 581]